MVLQEFGIVGKKDGFIKWKGKNMKEKVERDIYLRVQPSLYKEFKESCDKNYQTISAAIRELMKKYIKDNK